LERPTCEEILRHPWLLKHSCQLNALQTGLLLESSNSRSSNGIGAVNASTIVQLSRVQSVSSIFSAKQSGITSDIVDDDQIVPNMS